MSKVSIIIPTYNSFSHLRQCIDVLRMYDLPPCEFIVVDNESADGTKEWLAAQPNIIVVNGKNTWGLSKSFNEGRKKAQGDFLLFLHDDVTCSQEVVPALLETVKIDGVAAAGPFTNRSMHKKQNTHIQNYETIGEMQACASKISNYGKDIFVDPYLFLESFCLMVRAGCFDEVNGFDEHFDCAGYEGVDLSFRLTKAGYWICTTNVYVHHEANVDAHELFAMDKKEIEEGKFKDKWGVNLSYSSIVRHELLGHIDIKRPGLSVLELGCALGGNLMYIKWMNRDAILTAVELDASAAEIAKNYGEVSVMDVETINFEAKNEKYDYVIAGDLIEHLRDPWGLVKKIADILKPNGKFIVSIPNVAHVSNIWNLLNGRWDYEDSGLLDRTHLRFFTRETMVAMFEEAGFSIETCEYSKYSMPEKITRFIDTLTSLPEISISREDLEAYQVLIKAGKNI